MNLAPRKAQQEHPTRTRTGGKTRTFCLRVGLCGRDALCCCGKVKGLSTEKRKRTGNQDALYLHCDWWSLENRSPMESCPTLSLTSFTSSPYSFNLFSIRTNAKWNLTKTELTTQQELQHLVKDILSSGDWLVTLSRGLATGSRGLLQTETKTASDWLKGAAAKVSPVQSTLRDLTDFLARETLHTKKRNAKNTNVQSRRLQR